MAEFDPVNKPSHYIKSSVLVQPIELTGRVNSCLGQALNYVFRAPYKDNEIEDLEKAIFYLNKYKDVVCSYKDDWEYTLSKTELTLGKIFAKYTKDYLTKSVLGALFECRALNEKRINKAIAFIEQRLNTLKDTK